VGMARHYGPRSWIPRNSGSLAMRCPIARAVVGAGPWCVTCITSGHRDSHGRAILESISVRGTHRHPESIELPAGHDVWQAELRRRRDCVGHPLLQRVRCTLLQGTWEIRDR